MKLRWAMFTLGAWLFGSVMMAVVATENFYVIDRLLQKTSTAGFNVLLERLGPPQTRELLRYLASELNRLYFGLWNVVQLVFAVLLVWLLARDPATMKARSGALAMLIIVLVMLMLTPAITTIGRSLDFAPRNRTPVQLQRFWMLHAAYTALSLIQLAIGIVMAVAVGRVTLGADTQIEQPREAGIFT